MHSSRKTIVFMTPRTWMRHLIAPLPSSSQVTDSLIYRSDRVKPEVARWVDDLARWDFTTISPSHFAAGPGTPEDLRAAFATTLQQEPRVNRAPYDKNDIRLLDDIAGELLKVKII